MSLKKKISGDLKKALKDKDVLRRSVLTMLNAAILYREKEKRTKLSKTEEMEKLEELSKLNDEEIIEVISSEAKKRKDSIEQYEKASRTDLPRTKLDLVRGLVEQEKKELEILKEYLPEQTSEEEVRKLTKETIEKLGASGQKDIGKVMAALMIQLKGKADGGLVSKIVQEELKEK